MNMRACSSSVLALAVAAAGLAFPSLADAGRLGKVTGGVNSQSSASRGGGSSGGGSTSSRPSGNTRPDRYQHDRYYHDRYRYYPGTFYGVYGYHVTCPTCPVVQRRPPSPPAPPRLDLFVGAQSVKESDGAIALSTRLSHRGIGFGISSLSFFERSEPAGAFRPSGQGDLPSAEWIRMDVFSLHVAGRLIDTGATELWLEGGLGGARSNQFETLLGTSAGAELEHRLGGDLALIGGARWLFLEHGIRARELRAGVRAAFVHVGYRRLEFVDAGPPLEGPEAGVAFRF
jgi:hypothetical protein